MRIKSFQKTLILAILLLIPVQLGKHFWPDFSFFYGIKVDYLSPTIYLTDIFIILFTVTTLFTKDKNHSKESVENQISPLQKTLILFFLLFSIFSIFWSKNQLATIYLVGKLIEYFLFGIAIIKYTKNNKIKFTPLVYAAAIESLIVIAQFILQKSLGFWILGERDISINTPAVAKIIINGSEYLRPYGTFPHPNILSGYLLISLLFAFSLQKNQPKIKYLIPPIFIALILTFSRISLALLLINILIFLFTLKPKKQLLLALIMLFITSLVLIQRTGQLVLQDSVSLQRRIELTNSATNLILQNPLLGTGFGVSILSVAQNSRLTGPVRFIEPIHNIPLLILAEIGVVGAFSFFLFYLLILKQTIRQKSIFAVILGDIILIGLFDHYFFTLQQGQLMLTLILSLALTKNNV